MAVAATAATKDILAITAIPEEAAAVVHGVTDNADAVTITAAPIVVLTVHSTTPEIT